MSNNNNTNNNANNQANKQTTPKKTTLPKADIAVTRKEIFDLNPFGKKSNN